MNTITCCDCVEGMAKLPSESIRGSSLRCDSDRSTRRPSVVRSSVQSAGVASLSLNCCTMTTAWSRGPPSVR